MQLELTSDEIDALSWALIVAIGTGEIKDDQSQTIDKILNKLKALSKA